MGVLLCTKPDAADGEVLDLWRSRKDMKNTLAYLDRN